VERASDRFVRRSGRFFPALRCFKNKLVFVLERGVKRAVCGRKDADRDTNYAGTAPFQIGARHKTQQMGER
jgi:hypothetical protein